MNDTSRETIESHGEPRPDSRPVDLPCKGPACNKRILTYLTDADTAAHETIQVLRFTPETDDERLVQYWFCSSECRTAFIEDADRDETLYDEETPNADQQEDREQ
jgi:hypothetical protein